MMYSIWYKEIWYKEGKQHRDEIDPETGLTLPDVIWVDGSKEWYKNGKRHREGDLPAIIYPNGHKVWYKNGIEYYSG